MNLGLIKWFDIEKGFGVIKSVPDDEVFVHKNEFTIVPENISTGTALVYELKQGRGRLEGSKCHSPTSYEDWKLMMDLLEKPDKINLEIEIRVNRRFGEPHYKREVKVVSLLSYAFYQILKAKGAREIKTYITTYYDEVIVQNKNYLFYKFASFLKEKIHGLNSADGEHLLKVILNHFNQNKTDNTLSQAWLNDNPGILNYTSFPPEELTASFFKEYAHSIKQEHLSKIKDLTNADDALIEIFNFNLERFLENQALDEYVFLTKIIDSIFSEELKTQCNLKLATSQSLIPHIADDKMLYELCMRFSTKEICISVVNKWYHQNNSLTIALLKKLVEIEYPLNEIQQDFFLKFSESASVAEFKSLLNIYSTPFLVSKLIEKIDFIKEDPIYHLKEITDLSIHRSIIEKKIINLIEDIKISFNYAKLKKASSIVRYFGNDFFPSAILKSIEQLSKAEFLNVLNKASGNKDLSSNYDLNSAVQILEQSLECLFSEELITQQKKILEDYIIHNSSTPVIIQAWEQDLIPSFITYLTTDLSSFSNDNLVTIFETGKLESTLIHKLISNKLQEGGNDEWVLKSAYKFIELNEFKKFDNIIFEQCDGDGYFNLWKRGIGKILPVQYIKKLLSENSSEIYHVHNWVKERLCKIENIADILLQLLDETNNIADRKSFYLKFRCIKCLVDLNMSYKDEILKRKDDFNALILWFLELQEHFNFQLLQRKFIYFSPADQVKIIKRLFHLKHHGKLQFSINELEDILRADLDLFLINERFNDDFVLDISTSLIIELIKNYQSQGRFLADSELLKIILHDIGKEKRKKFKIEGYFEDCKGRMDAEWNWKNTSGTVYKKANGNDYFFVIEFEYDANLVNEVKNIPGRKFDSAAKNWTAPSSSEPQVLSFIKQHRFFFNTGANNFSNNPHLAVLTRKEVPIGIKFCEGRIANKKDARLDKPFWWCLNQPCLQHCETEHLSPESDYNELTLLDLLKIFVINVDENSSYGFFPNGKYYHLISQINRFNRLLERLYCQECDEILFPVQSSNFAAYTVVRFSCQNKNCAEHGKEVYLNHCLDGNCNSIIDSRISKKCDNGLYICKSCGGCCSHDMLSRRLDNLRTTGGFIYQNLIDCVEDKKGHKDKNEYFCYKCSKIMTEVIDDIKGEDSFFKCLDCNVEYHPSSQINRPHIHLRRPNYPVIKLSQLGK